MARHVETQHGKAKVNWYRNSKLGVSYLELGDSDNKFADVLSEEEVDFKYGEISPEERKKDVRRESDQDLRSRLKKLRQERAEKSSTSKKKSQNASSKRKSSKKKKSKSTSPSQSDIEKKLESLSEEEREQLKEMLGDN